MKYFPFLTIYALLFLPTPVEGTIAYIYVLVYVLYNRIFFPERRNERDCDALILSSGLDTGVIDESVCECINDSDKSLFVFCLNLKDAICLPPYDAKYCSVSGSTYYYASTTKRSALSFFTSPLINEEGIQVELEVPDFKSTYSVGFLRGDGSPSSKKYASCNISAYAGPSMEEPTFRFCASCDICDSGVDWKYDCSNTNGTLAFSNITNTTVVVPGPKVESCFPVADIIPTN